MAGETRVGVAFSGGLDSSIITKCAMRRGEAVACTGYSEGSGDAARASEAARALGAELVVTKLAVETVASELSRIDLPYAPTLMDKSLWCLYSVVAQSARDSGAKVILLGQLADELFGGYAKYAETLRAEGKDGAGLMMENDVARYFARGRVRDARACGRWLEPRFPFEDSEIIEFAASLPVSFKIRDGVRKAILREAALLLGVPEDLARAPKKAAQYSSGVQRLVIGSHF